MGTQGRSAQTSAKSHAQYNVYEGRSSAQGSGGCLPEWRMALDVSPVSRLLTLAAAEYLESSRCLFHRQAAGLFRSLGMASQVPRFSPNGGQTDASCLASRHTFQAQRDSAAMTALEGGANLALLLTARPSENYRPDAILVRGPLRESPLALFRRTAYATLYRFAGR
jgi:hypothetical protein